VLVKLDFWERGERLKFEITFWSVVSKRCSIIANLPQVTLFLVLFYPHLEICAPHSRLLFPKAANHLFRARDLPFFIIENLLLHIFSVINEQKYK